MGSTRKAQPTREDPAAAENKKLRNRLSQQAFRKRQTDRILELEKQLRDASKTDNERVLQLEKENKILRQQLATFVQKLESAQKALKELCNAAHATLVVEHTDEVDKYPPGNVSMQSPASDSVAVGQYQPTGQPQDHEGTVNFDILPPTSPEFLLLENDQDKYMNSQLTDVLQNNATTSSAFPLPHELTTFNHLLPSLPGIWSYNYQMGPASYASAMDGVSRSRSSFHLSNSAFSDHIFALHQFIQRSWRTVSAADPPARQLPKFHLCVSMMLSMFNSLSRPLALSWYTPTKFYYHITHLTMWQLNPTRDSYMRLPVRYRPSALQLSEKYPPIIDWCPFPSIRDKLILLHSANSAIDQIICDIATAYVIEVDISTYVSSDWPTPGYIRIWDLIQAMGALDDEDIASAPAPAPPVDNPLPFGLASGVTGVTGVPAASSSTGYKLPAPSVDALFQHKVYARLAFHRLHTAESLARYKLDGQLFEKYPELYEVDDHLIAEGVALRPSRQTSIPVPKALSRDTLNIYRHFADWSLNVIFSSRC